MDKVAHLPQEGAVRLLSPIRRQLEQYDPQKMLGRVVADPIVEWSPDASLTRDSVHLFSPLICGSLL